MSNHSHSSTIVDLLFFINYSYRQLWLGKDQERLYNRNQIQFGQIKQDHIS